MRNVSDKYCGENQNHILGSNTFLKNLLLWDNVE